MENLIITLLRTCHTNENHKNWLLWAFLADANQQVSRTVLRWSPVVTIQNIFQNVFYTEVIEMRHLWSHEAQVGIQTTDPKATWEKLYINQNIISFYSLCASY